MNPLKFIDQIKDMYNDQDPGSTIPGPRNMADGGRIGYDDGQFVEPRQGFYKKGFVKPDRLTKKEIDQRYKAKKLKENPEYKSEIHERYKAKKLKKDPEWNPYKEGSIYRKRIEAKKKGLVYDIETGETRKAQPTGFQKTYHKFEAGDKKLIKEWRKTLTDAAKKGDMSQTTGFKDWLSKKFDSKAVNTIRARTRLKLGFFSGQEYNNAQENFVKSLIKEHNESDKLLHTKESIWKKTRFDKASDMGKRMWKLMDDSKTGLENIDIKVNKAIDKIIDGNLPLRTSKKVTRHISQYSPIIQMISEISGAGGTHTIQAALLKNPRFKDKEFAETFRYLNRAHAKDFLGLPFNEAFEYAKFRQGGLDVKGMLSYTTRYQNPESNIMSFAVRHANRHFRDGTKSQVKFYNLKADGTKGAYLSWDKLPKNRDGDRVLDLKKVGFEYKDQFFHKNNLKTKGYKSGLFDEVYAMSGKNRLLVPNPNDLSSKITLKKLLQMTGDKLTIGHDEALGGVKGSPFKNLKLQGEKLNSALFHAYDKIQNKDLRRLILNQLEGQFKGLSGGDYEKAFVEGKIDEAKKAITSTDTLYRGAGKEVIKEAGPDLLQWSSKKQKEILRVAGIDDKGFEKLKRQILKKMGNKVTNKEAGFIATDILKDFGKMGLKGGRLLKMLELQYEPIFEGLFYQYAKQYKGYDHGLAREELFLPKMIAKAAPDLWKKVGFKPFKTGVWEGADPLIEKQLREYGGGEYIDRTNKVNTEVDKYHTLENDLSMMQVSHGDYTAASPEKIKAKEKEIENQRNLLIDLEHTIKPGTPAHDAYMIAKEKQDFEFGKNISESDKRKEMRRHKEYLEYKGGKQRSFLLPKEKGKKRVEDPLFKKPYTFLETDDTFLDILKPGKKAWEEFGLTDTQVGPVVKEGIKDKWKQIYDMGGIDLMDKIGIAGGVANMAGGGMVGIRKPGAIAPTGGPQSQGLASTPEYGTYNKEYKWQI